MVGGAYRKNNVTTMELRFNPMKRNRGGEQDLDHIIAAALRGMDRATLEYPIRPGLIFCLDRAFSYELNEIIAEKAIAWRDRGIVGDRHRRSRNRPPSGLPTTATCSGGLAGSGSASPSMSARSGPVEEVAQVIELLEPDRIGHGVKSAYDPRTMGMLRERGIVLEICPTSNLQTEVVSGWEEFRWIFDQFRRNEVRFAISTDGPEMLRTYIRDELATLGRLGILSYEEQLAGGPDVAPGVVRAQGDRRRRGRAHPGDPRRGGAGRGLGPAAAVAADPREPLPIQRLATLATAG